MSSPVVSKRCGLSNEPLYQLGAADREPEELADCGPALDASTGNDGDGVANSTDNCPQTPAFDPATFPSVSLDAPSAGSITLKLLTPAPPGGGLVRLQSSLTSLDVPTTITIPSAESTATVKVNVHPVSSSQTGFIAAHGVEDAGVIPVVLNVGFN